MNNKIDILLEKYNPLVIKIAKVITPIKEQSRLLDDVCQEGRIALIKAYEKYDSTKNSKFINYAYKVIYTAQRDFLASQRYSVSLSTSAYRTIQKYFYNDFNNIKINYSKQQLNNINNILSLIKTVDIDEEKNIGGYNE